MVRDGFATPFEMLFGGRPGPRLPRSSSSEELRITSTMSDARLVARAFRVERRVGMFGGKVSDRKCRPPKARASRGGDLPASSPSAGGTWIGADWGGGRKGTRPSSDAIGRLGRWSRARASVGGPRRHLRLRECAPWVALKVGGGQDCSG